MLLAVVVPKVVARGRSGRHLVALHHRSAVVSISLKKKSEENFIALLFFRKLRENFQKRNRYDFYLKIKRCVLGSGDVLPDDFNVVLLRQDPLSSRSPSRQPVAVHQVDGDPDEARDDEYGGDDDGGDLGGGAGVHGGGLGRGGGDLRRGYVGGGGEGADAGLAGGLGDAAVGGGVVVGGAGVRSSSMVVVVMVVPVPTSSPCTRGGRGAWAMVSHGSKLFIQHYKKRVTFTSSTLYNGVHNLHLSQRHPRSFASRA